MSDRSDRLLLERPDAENVEELSRRFVKQVRGLPQVEQVLLDTSAALPRIWAVLDQDAGNRPRREAVYQAQLAALDSVPDTLVGFRLINLAEFPEAEREALLPAGAAVIWRR